MTGVWHVYDGAKKEGPLSAQEVATRYAAGELGEGALAWREGWPEWRPIAAALAWLGDAAGLETETKASTPQAKSPAPVGPALLALAIIVAATACGKWLFDAQSQVIGAGSPATVVQSYRLLVAGMAAAMAGVVVPSWWLCGRVRRWRPNSLAPGLVRALLVLGATLGAIFIVLQLRLTPLVRDIANREAAQVAKVTFQPAGRWVDIQGAIGPRLTAQVSQSLRAHPDAAGIRIDSPGGMTSEALRVARIIETRGLDVRVEHECVSACIAILVSGRRRTAEWNARIALHALAPVVNTYPAFLELITQQGRGEFEGYVADHGMPKAWINEAEAIGPRQVRPTPPPDLLAVGVLTAVTRDGAPLNVDNAKWLWVEAQAGERNGVAEMLEAVRVSAPHVVRASADELYSSVGSGDPRRAGDSIRSVLGPVVDRAQTTAAAGPTYLQMESSLDQLTYLSRAGDWSACEAYLEGRLASGSGSPELKRREMIATAAMIRSAGQAGWRTIETRAEDLAAARQVASAAAQRVTALGLSSGAHGSDRGKCLAALYGLQGLDRMGAERGAAAWQALLEH